VRVAMGFVAEVFRLAAQAGIMGVVSFSDV
jgi:hypothetical protein